MSSISKYEKLCQFVQSEYPVLAGVWLSAPERFGAEWLDEFINNIEILFDGDFETSAKEAIDGYAEFAWDSLRHQALYEQTGQYPSDKYEDVEHLYHDSDHMMRCYLPGMYVSHFLWPQHFNMLQSFRKVLLPRIGNPKLFFEVGTGCGMYSKTVLEQFPEVQGAGFDISEHALNFTKQVATAFGNGDRYSIHQHDIFNPWKEQADFLICQEVLEHIEEPVAFTKALAKMVKKGGFTYITAALNASHSDHIYHFKTTGEVEDVIREAGLKPLGLQEEFASGNKPRLYTPSLAGFLCEV